MKLAPRSSAASLLLALSMLLLPASAGARAYSTPLADDETTAQEQQTNALQRGYRTGYSDGYQAGWRDSVERRARDYASKEDYKRGDRVYVPAYGTLEDYSDGYRQGFEAGYAAGYDRRGFESTVPDNIARRDTTTAASIDDADTSGTSTSTSGRRTIDDASTSGNVSDSNPSRRGARGGAIPAGTSMRVELSNRLSSDISYRGDPFEARVLEPREYEGAIVSGRVSRVERAGKVKGTAQLQLTFEQIRFTDGRTEDFSAQVTEVIQPDDDSGVGEVDPEGGVRGRDTTKGDVAKVGAAAGIGAIIGAIAGGGKGAGIGAVIGGATGAGGVMTQRGKDIRLERGQHLMIRASR